MQKDTNTQTDRQTEFTAITLIRGVALSPSDLNCPAFEAMTRMTSIFRSHELGAWELTLEFESRLGSGLGLRCDGTKLRSLDAATLVRLTATG